jgi:hypothetical protein
MNSAIVDEFTAIVASMMESGDPYLLETQADDLRVLPSLAATLRQPALR